MDADLSKDAWKNAKWAEFDHDPIGTATYRRMKHTRGGGLERSLYLFRFLVPLRISECL